MRELYRSEHFLVMLDEQQRLLRRSRTDKSFASDAEVVDAFQAVWRLYEGFDRASYLHLVDVRLAPPRNDPAFERIVKPFQPALFGGFRRLAVITKTEAGRLQITRLLQAHSITLRTFMDEPTALAYLLEPEGLSRGADTRTPPRS